MKFLHFIASVLAGGCLTASSAEIITNRNFSEMKNNVPAGWEYQQNPTKPDYKVNPTEKSLTITGETTAARGVAMFRVNKEYPAGSLITVSGEYKTGEVSFDKKGSTFISIMCRHVRDNDNQPKFWLNTDLKPADQWTSFKQSKRLTFSVESIQMNVALWLAKGSLSVRNLSIDVQPPSPEPDSSREFVWREAEDLEKIKPASDWGHDLAPEYFSGKGGIMMEKKNIDWNFQIDPVTDPVTLFSKPRTWYLWARVYGYLESPRIMIYHNDRFLAFVDTPANEKSDKKGKYAGPGKYVWVLCGQFNTTGGGQQISFRPQGRMMLDAVLLTTDEKYAPVKFEARQMKQAPVLDIMTANMIKAEYAFEGVTDTVTLPLSFRIGGKAKCIPNDQKPAVFHFSLPDYIKVEGVTSHWAGEDWNVPARWGKKFLTWKKTGSRTVRGMKYNDYEANLYYLSGNQYLVFLRADSRNFKPGEESICEYWLESNGEKQAGETIALKHISIPAAKPFKNIYIGPSYVPFNMMYRSYPDVFKNMNSCGFNYIGCWAKPWEFDQSFDKFRNEAYAKNFMITVVVEQYTGIQKEHVATGIDGKQLLSGISGHGSKILTLAMDENDAPIKETLERTRLCASTGVSVEYDDEMTNVLWDKIDYSPAVKKLFREWLAANRKGVAYKEPELIVRDKEKDPAMYAHWVDFKCARIAYWYSLYRKAFDEGAALAKGKYPASMQPKMLTCIQGLIQRPDGKTSTAETVKESGYLDYRLLNQYCDIIQIMSYTYGGVRESAKPGDVTEMYNRYIGKCNTVPILLAGGYGTEVTPENKVMLKYQVLDSLMQKPKLIIFYAGATVFNAPTMAPVTEAIRIAQPYEDFFVNGERYEAVSGSADYLRLKALKLGNKVLLYAANYTNPVNRTVTVTFPSAIQSAVECDGLKKMKVEGKQFSFDFQSSRGKLFLLEL